LENGIILYEQPFNPIEILFYKVIFVYTSSWFAKFYIPSLVFDKFEMPIVAFIVPHIAIFICCQTPY
jgi:hypothetical protein